MKVFLQNNGMILINGSKVVAYSQGVKLSYLIYADTDNSVVRAIVPDNKAKQYESVISQVDPEYKKTKLTEHKGYHWFEFKVPDLKVVFE